MTEMTDVSENSNEEIIYDEYMMLREVIKNPRSITNIKFDFQHGDSMGKNKCDIVVTTINSVHEMKTYGDATTEMLNIVLHYMRKWTGI